MKRIVSTILAMIVIIAIAVIPASASDGKQNIQTTTSVEYLDDGSYFIIETTQVPTITRSTSKTASGSKTANRNQNPLN